MLIFWHEWISEFITIYMLVTAYTLHSMQYAYILNSNLVWKHSGKFYIVHRWCSVSLFHTCIEKQETDPWWLFYISSGLSSKVQKRWWNRNVSIILSTFLPFLFLFFAPISLREKKKEVTIILKIILTVLFHQLRWFSKCLKKYF